MSLSKLQHNLHTTLLRTMKIMATFTHNLESNHQQTMKTNMRFQAFTAAPVFLVVMAKRHVVCYQNFRIYHLHLQTCFRRTFVNKST